MPTMQAFTAGLDAFARWNFDTFRWVLLSDGTFDPAADTVADVIGAGTELGVASYNRLDVQGKEREVDDGNNRIVYKASHPDFGTLEADDQIKALLLYRYISDDTNSVPVGWWEFNPAVPSDAIDPMLFVFTDGIVATVDQA